MTAKEKYMEEKDELKSSRMNRIFESAFSLFSEKGIDTIAMVDIAKAAEIGVASLYRYFSTKDEIAIRTVIWAWDKQKQILLPSLEDEEYKNLSGINQLAKILSLFVELYKNQSEFLRLIYFFDSYAVRTGISPERLIDYEKMIESIKVYVINAINKGIEDETINKKFEDQKDELYFTVMHALFNTAQKLTLSGKMLNMDKNINGLKELNTLSNIIIDGLK